MADEKLALTATPTTIAQALDMSAALSGNGDGRWWFETDEAYEGVEYASAEELIETIQERATALEELGRRLIAGMPADLPASRNDAQTQEQLDMIVLREQITKTLLGAGNSRSNISIILDPSASNPNDGIERYQRIIEAQYSEIETLYDTDDTQDAQHAMQYLAEQRRAYNTLLGKLDQLDAVRTAVSAAHNNNTPMSRETWASISNVDLPVEDMSDIQQVAGLNKFYANLEQQSVAVSFIEMRAKQVELRNMASTLRIAGDEDTALQEEARADALDIILDREADILQLVQDSVTAGNGKQTVIGQMNTSDQAAAVVMLQAQERDYALIDHASESLRRVYESNTPADRNDLLGILSPSGQPETIAQAQLYAQWNVNFTTDSRAQAETLFAEMKAQIEKLEQDAVDLASADPDAAEKARQLAFGLNSVFVKKDDILAMMQDNITASTNTQTAIDQLTSQRHLATAISSLAQQQVSLDTSDHVVASLQNMIDSDTPATRANTLGLLLDNGQVETMAQAKTVSRWNIETARTELDQANIYYTQLEALQQQFTDLAASYADPSLADELAAIQERSAELQTILDDKDNAIAKIETSIETMEDKSEEILRLPDDGSKFSLAQTLLNQQQAELSSISGIINQVDLHVTNYRTAHANGGGTANTNITSGQAAVVPSTAQAVNTVANPVTGTGVQNIPRNTRNGVNNMQTTEAEQIAALKADAESLIGFEANPPGSEKTLSNGDKIKFGTNTIQNTASNNYDHMNKLVEEAEKLRDSLTEDGRTEEADSITRVLGEMERYRDEANAIGLGLVDLNEQAQTLENEISESRNINEINAKLVELRAINLEMENIALSQFHPITEAFNKIITDNKVMNEQLNGEMGFGGLVRTHFGELGRRIVGESDGGPSLLGDFGNAAANTWNDLSDWWTEGVGGKYGNTTGWMVANVALISAVGAAGISLWNNTGGALTGIQLNGIWKFLGVAAIAGIAMANSGTAEAYENRQAVEGGFGNRGNSTTNSFSGTRQASGNISPAGGSAQIIDPKTGEVTATITVPDPAAAATTDQSGSMQLQGNLGRTTAQGAGNTPIVLPPADERVSNDDTVEALPSVTGVPLTSATQAATAQVTQ